MAGDPITDIKKELGEIHATLDKLREAIESSKQSVAASHFHDITTKLEKIQRRLENEFSWLAPQTEEE